MSKILPTIGPVTQELKSIKKILKFSDLIRINGSHANLKWHTEISKKVRQINKNAKILLDVPGIKPRTNNQEDIVIKKGEKVIFYYKTFDKSFEKIKSIELTNPLPKITKTNKIFTLSDGQYQFSLMSFSNNYILGKSLENFILKPKKGLNVPYSEYSEKEQKKIYLNFLKKFSQIKANSIGLSFIQNDNILKLIRKKYPQYVLVSKIENFIGLKNIEKISKSSDVIMIDRGDLSAEIGEKNLYQAIINISEIAKKNGKPLIMATENLDSMMLRKSPTKSEIISIGHSLRLNADKIMLSDETATSKNWYSIIKWLDNFIRHNESGVSIIKKNHNQFFWEILENVSDLPVVIFSKKGFALEQLAKVKENVDLTVFTDSEKVSTLCIFRGNTNVYKIEDFDKSHLSKHIFKNIKKNKNKIFNKRKQALLIYVAYPRKDSRANTLSLISLEDFK